MLIPLKYLRYLKFPLGLLTLVILVFGGFVAYSQMTSEKMTVSDLQKELDRFGLPAGATEVNRESWQPRCDVKSVTGDPWAKRILSVQGDTPAALEHLTSRAEYMKWRLVNSSGSPANSFTFEKIDKDAVPQRLLIEMSSGDGREARLTLQFDRLCIKGLLETYSMDLKF